MTAFPPHVAQLADGPAFVEQLLLFIGLVFAVRVLWAFFSDI